MDKQQPYSPRTKTLFVIYAVLCVLLFLYLRFPYDLLRPKIEEALSAVVHKEITLGAITPRLPWGVTVEDMRIGGATFAPRLTVRPSLLSLLTGKIGFSFTVQQDQGRLKGKIKTSLRHPGDPLAITLKMKQFDLAPLQKMLKGGSEIEGTIDGSFILETSRERFQESQGTIACVWEKGQIPLHIESFPLAAIPFERLEIDARMDKGVLAILKADLSGNEVSGRLSGNVKLGQNASSSRLNINGDLSLAPGYRRMMGAAMGDRMKFTLGGTLGMPRFTLQ